MPPSDSHKWILVRNPWFVGALSAGVSRWWFRLRDLGAGVGNGHTIAWTTHERCFRLAIGHQLWQITIQKEGEHDRKLNGELHRDHRPSLRCDELEAMLIYSMSVSVDGFIADREDPFEWTVPGEEQFRFHVAQTRELGSYLCGRRLSAVTVIPDTKIW